MFLSIEFWGVRSCFDVATKKKEPKWRNSKARAMLVKMLFDTNSKAHKLSWQELHASHEWFREYEPKKFKKYLSRLKKANPRKVAIVAEDNMIIEAELQNFPRSGKTNRGEPFWDTHPAKLLLREDVKAGKHLDMKPQVLHQTRPDYQAFSLKTFRRHVYQEKRHQKKKFSTSKALFGDDDEVNSSARTIGSGNAKKKKKKKNTNEAPESPRRQPTRNAKKGGKRY